MDIDENDEKSDEGKDEHKDIEEQYSPAPQIRDKIKTKLDISQPYILNFNKLYNYIRNIFVNLCDGKYLDHIDLFHRKWGPQEDGEWPGADFICEHISWGCGKFQYLDEKRQCYSV